MTPVISSNLAAVGYYGTELIIAFHNGSVYAYTGVPLSVYSGLMQASSHGTYFSARIRKRYPYRRIQ